MRKTILTLVTIITVAGTILVPAPPVQAAPEAAPLRDLVTTNDNNQIIIYSGGSWSHQTAQSGWINEDYHTSDNSNDYAQFRFYGTAVTLISQLNSDQGEADIYMDTVLQETIDLYAASPSPQQAIYSKTGLSIGYHTIKVLVKHTKNASSTGYAVNVDAFRYVDSSLQEPPPTNEIECPSQVAGTMVCTQLDTQRISIAGTNVDIGHHNPRWTIWTSGIGTVYAKMTGLTVHIWNGQSGTRRLGFSAVSHHTGNGLLDGYDAQWTDLGDSSDHTVNIGSLSAEYPVATAAMYYTGIQAQRCSPNCGIHGDATATFVLEVQTIPFADQCLSQYTSLMSAGPYVINPTVGAPLGPLGSPPDEQTYPITPGYAYMIRVGGDPWHNGNSTDQNGADYSWDGATWYNLKEDPNCINFTDSFYQYSSIVTAPAGASTFYIRVTDPGGNYADNYMDTNEAFIYTISLVILIGAVDCEGQFSYDPEADLVSSTTVPANQEYVTASTALVPNDWYVIEVASGSWQDGGAGALRYDAQFSFGEVISGEPGGMNIWHNIAEGGAGVFCATDSGNYATVYTQADNSAFLYLRVNDTGLVFAGNTGSLVINVYHTSFQMRPAQCELTMNAESFIGHTELGAQNENGVTIGISASINEGSQYGTMRMEPGAWYMIETTDGPWGYVGSTHSDYSYDIEVFWGGDWVPLESWSESTCNVAIDALGHRRVYFQTPETGAASYKFRVADSDTWFNNVGNMGIDTYTAYSGEGVTPAGTCDYIYDVDQPVTPLPQEVDATLKNGAQVANPSMLTANTIYAFVIEGNDYAWYEGGGDPLYGMQISDDNGTSWHDVPAGYGPVLCYIQNGNQLTLFIKYGYNYNIRFRVDSTTFSDNTGEMGINIYPANAGDTVDPWVSCTSGLALHPVITHEWIDVRSEAGQNIQIVDAYQNDQQVLGFVVEIEYGTGPWDDGETDTQHYDAELSSDNGATWYPMDETNPDLICAKLDLLKRYATAYFEFQDGQKWKIRVNDEETDLFTDNSGNLAYKLFSVTDAWSTPDCLVDTNSYDCLPPGVYIGGLDVCTSAVITPVAPTTIDVPDWLAYLAGWTQYGVQVILQYMAWCPRHTDALTALMNLFLLKDPIALLNEIQQVLTRIQTELEGHNWADTGAEQTLLTTSESSGGAADSIMNRLFPSEAAGPWNGGPLITMASWSGSTRYSNCVADYTDLLTSEALTSGLCFVSSAATEVGASFILQIMLELAAIGFLLHDLVHQAQTLAEFMAGNRSE